MTTGGGRKTDTHDAHAVAQVALHQHARLRIITAEDQTVILRLLSERRDDLTAEAPACSTGCTNCCAS